MEVGAHGLILILYGETSFKVLIPLADHFVCVIPGGELIVVPLGGLNQNISILIHHDFFRFNQRVGLNPYGGAFFQRHPYGS